MATQAVPQTGFSPHYVIGHLQNKSLMGTIIYQFPLPQDIIINLFPEDLYRLPISSHHTYLSSCVLQKSRPTILAKCTTNHKHTCIHNIYADTLLPPTYTCRPIHRKTKHLLAKKTAQHPDSH